MKITTPNGILEAESIEAILEKYGRDCLRGADLCHANLNGADLSDAILCHANLNGADLSGANHVKLSIAKISILPDEGDIIGWEKSMRRR